MQLNSAGRKKNAFSGAEFLNLDINDISKQVSLLYQVVLCILHCLKASLTFIQCNTVSPPPHSSCVSSNLVSVDISQCILGRIFPGVNYSSSVKFRAKITEYQVLVNYHEIMMLVVFKTTIWRRYSYILHFTLRIHAWRVYLTKFT